MMDLLEKSAEPGLDSTLPALLLRIDRNVLHHGALGAARSLGRAGVEVHAFVEHGNTPLARSRYLSGSHRGNWTTRPPEELTGHLASVARSIGRPALLIPTDDVGAIYTAEHAAALAGSFVLPRQEPGLPRRMAGKASLAQECRRLGIPHPETCVPGSLAEAEAAISGLGLPVVAKLAEPWRPRPHPLVRSTTVIRTAGELRDLWVRCGGTLVLQRYLPGEPGSDWFFQGYFDALGRCRFGGVGIKSVAYPPGAGQTVVGRTAENPQVESLARRIVEAVGYKGVVDLDLRYEVDSDTYYLLDFNPRLGAQFRLFADGHGTDIVRAMHLDFSGRSVRFAGSGQGRLFVAENLYLRSLLHWRTRPGARDRKGAGGKELAWFAGDDPLPFVFMCVLSVHGALLRVARRFRSWRREKGRS